MTSAKSIKEFCRSYGISNATFFRRRDDMPKTILVGRQVRITAVDEAEWLETKRAESRGAEQGGAK